MPRCYAWQPYQSANGKTAVRTPLKALSQPPETEAVSRRFRDRLRRLDAVLAFKVGEAFVSFHDRDRTQRVW